MPTRKVKPKMLGTPNTDFARPCDYARMQAQKTGRAERAQGDPVLGAMIRAKREELKLSQSKLGEAVGKSRSHVANIEAGRDGAGARMLADMAKTLGLSLDRLMNSQPAGTPGTFTVTVTEDEADLLIATRGHPVDEIKSLAKMLLRGNQSPKQS